jgi:hypothetical protein
MESAGCRDTLDHRCRPSFPEREDRIALDQKLTLTLHESFGVSGAG